MTAKGWPVMTPEGRTRIYLLGAGIAHLRHMRGFQQGPVCGGFDADGDRWLGTGSQEEYETAAALPLCGECAADAGATDGKTGEGQ